MTLSSSNLDAAGQLVRRNGFPFLFVYGDCSYYAIRGADHEGKPSASLAGVRRGRLSSELLGELLTALRHAEWPRLQTEPERGPLRFDSATAIVADGSSHLFCASECMSPSSSSAARAAIFAKADEWIGRLFDEGQPSTGAARVLIETWNETYSFEAATWPLDTSPASWVGMPVKIDGAQAEPLRQLRTQQVPGAFGPWWNGVGPELPVRASGTSQIYDMVVSDVLPMEDAAGRVPLPCGASGC